METLEGCGPRSGGQATMSATSPSAFPPVVRETLQSWFTQYGANDLFEIECRVQDVGEAGFERLLQSLASHTKRILPYAGTRR